MLNKLGNPQAAVSTSRTDLCDHVSQVKTRVFLCCSKEDEPFLGSCLPEPWDRLHRALHWEDDLGQGTVDVFASRLTRTRTPSPGASSRDSSPSKRRNSRSSPPGSLLVGPSRLDRRASKA